MADTTQPTAALPPPPPPTFWQRAGRWAGIAAGLIIGLVGLVRLVVSYTVLPSCESSRMTDTLRNIYRDQKLEYKGISDIKTVKSSSTEVTCTGVIDTGSEQQPVNFRSYWEGWTAKVWVQSRLPTCESPRTEETLRNIFKSRKVTINAIREPKTVSSSDAENVCTAQVDAPGELATITYRIFRKENEIQVLITDVKSQPK